MISDVAIVIVVLGVGTTLYAHYIMFGILEQCIRNLNERVKALEINWQ